MSGMKGIADVCGLQGHGIVLAGGRGVERALKAGQTWHDQESKNDKARKHTPIQTCV